MFSEKDINPSSYSPLALAFIGDTVFDLIVRESIIKKGNMPVKEMHSLAAGKVCAAAQSKAVKAILPILTEAETDIFKRGRNAHSGSMPKNQTSADYHYATGFECLIGWLYLSNRVDRIKELCAIIIGIDNSKELV